MIINERNHIASKLVVGIKDKAGKTNALSYSEVQETKIANKQTKLSSLKIIYDKGHRDPRIVNPFSPSGLIVFF